MTNEQIQLLLTFFGYYGGEIDGKLGSQSTTAIRAFQRDFGEGLVIDGKAGAKTQAAMRKAVAESWKPPKTDKPTAPTTGTFWDDLKYFARMDKGIRCPCGRCNGFPAEPTEKLMRTAERIREHFGVPMKPTSTVRCPAHNAEVDGVANSNHLKGQAMDFYIKGLSAALVLPYVQSLREVSYTYAINSDCVHITVK